MRNDAVLDRRGVHVSAGRDVNSMGSEVLQVPLMLLILVFRRPIPPGKLVHQLKTVPFQPGIPQALKGFAPKLSLAGYVDINEGLSAGV